MKTDTEYMRDLVQVISGNAITDEYGNALDPAGGGMSIRDISQFNAESSTTLGANGVFSGPWRDTTNFNWFAATSFADVAGSLFIDEAKDNLGTNATQVGAGVTATAQPGGSPNSGKFAARQVPSKTVLRFTRVRYVNGGTLQTVFDLQTALSPVN